MKQQNQINSGKITQTTLFLSYGELFVDQRLGRHTNSYIFNAKELDSETGLYYYGARYLDPTDAMWLSVDPLWEKYVGMTPYQYCAGNPVKLVDMDGREFTEEAEKWISRMNKYIDDKIGTYNDKISQCFDKLNEKNLSEKKSQKLVIKLKNIIAVR